MTPDLPCLLRPPKRGKQSPGDPRLTTPFTIPYTFYSVLKVSYYSIIYTFLSRGREANKCSIRGTPLLWNPDRFPKRPVPESFLSKPAPRLTSRSSSHVHGPPRSSIAPNFFSGRAPQTTSRSSSYVHGSPGPRWPLLPRFRPLHLRSTKPP